MNDVLTLPAHRYRMNALLALALTPGSVRHFQRVSDRLWAEARLIDTAASLRLDDGGERSVRVIVQQGGPPRGTFSVDLRISPELSTVALRFAAQRGTLEGAVEAAPGLWGAAAGVEADPEALSDDELERLFEAALDEIVPAGSVLRPWSPAATLLYRRLSERMPRIETRRRPLRAWRAARQEGLQDARRLTSLFIATTLRTWWIGVADRVGPCRVVVVGADAPEIALDLARDSRFEIARVADDEAVYTPASQILLAGSHPRSGPASREAESLAVTGPYDAGVLTEPVDALILLPGAPPIDRSTALQIGARLVVEAGDGLILPEADGTLAGRRIDTLPDLLFSAMAAMATRSFIEPQTQPQSQTQTTSMSTTDQISAEIARLIRELLRDASERGRSIREQVYLRALGNLQR